MATRVLSFGTPKWHGSCSLIRRSCKYLNTSQVFLFSNTRGTNEQSGRMGEECVSPGKKFAYGESNNGQRDRNAPGLFYLNTVRLPSELQENLSEFLKRYPKSILEQDGLKLSWHLKNRGRPTDRTWRKFKGARTALKARARAVHGAEVLRWENEHMDDDAAVGFSGHSAGDGADVHEIQKDEEQYSRTAEEVLNRTTGRHTKNSTRRPREDEYKVIRYGKREAAAFASSRIPACYGSTLRVFHEIARRQPDFRPETLLDFGSGTGTAVWAAHEKWGNSIKEYQCVDVAEDMNAAAEFLLRGGEGFKSPLHIPRVYFKRFLPVSNKVTYDIVVASFALSELPRAALRKVAISSLWGKTNDFLVIIEYGNNEGFDIALEARKLVLKEGNNAEDLPEQEFNSDILDSDEMKMDDGYVFAPLWATSNIVVESVLTVHSALQCPHDAPCPRDEVETRDHPCNFEQHVPLAFSQKNTSLKQRGFYTERFSYIVLRKGHRDTTESSWPRILRHVRKRKRHVVCNLCSSDGALEQKILTKRKHSDIYKCARHLNKWGDLLPVSDSQRPRKTSLVDQQVL